MKNNIPTAINVMRNIVRRLAHELDRAEADANAALLGPGRYRTDGRAALLERLAAIRESAMRLDGAALGCQLDAREI